MVLVRVRYAKLENRTELCTATSEGALKILFLSEKPQRNKQQQLQRLLNHLTTFYDQCHQLLDDQRFFPIEVDLAKGAFTYESVGGQFQVYCNQ